MCAETTTPPPLRPRPALLCVKPLCWFLPNAMFDHSSLVVPVQIVWMCWPLQRQKA